MASLNLLADLDAERINGGFGGWGGGYGGGKPSYRHKSRPSFSSTTYKSAKINLVQGNLANNLAIGIGFHGFGTASSISVQENVAFVNTIAA